MRPLLLLLISFTALTTRAAEPQTQLDLNTAAGQSFLAADKELNERWKQVLAANAADPKFIARLKTAQKAWLAFRDAQVAALYGDDFFSARPMCEAGVKEQLTRERSAYLKSLLEVVEGDVCAATAPPPHK
jgi:uncharacterized protein YecT (DUF1311 family)